MVHVDYQIYLFYLSLHRIYVLPFFTDRGRYFPNFHGCIEMTEDRVGMVMEFIGDEQTGETMPLGKVVYKGIPALTRRDWWKVAKDLVLAVQYVHDRGYLLNDLKEDNVLLSRSDGNVWRAVIVDFGWVCPQSEPEHFGFSDETKEKYTREKLFDHIAPECALLDEGTSTLSDVFQLGRLLRMIGARSGDTNLISIGDSCCHSTAMLRSSVAEVIQQVDRLATSL